MTKLISSKRNLSDEFVRNFNSLNTREAYSRDIRAFQDYLQGLNLSPNELKFATFLGYKELLLKSGLKPTSVGRRLSSIKSYLSWCVTQGVLTSNPITELKLPKSVVSNPTLALSDAEVQVLLELQPESYSDRLHLTILYILLFLGLRRSELVNIKVKDIYEDSGIPVIRVIGKGAKERVIPISPAVKVALESYLENHTLLRNSDFLLQASNLKINPNPLDVSTIYKLIRRKCKQVGITRRISPHSCRATVISHLLEQDASLRNVADFAGHSNVQTTMIYDKKRDGFKNSAAFKVTYGVRK